jgi:uncharacterized protein (DUF1810 family)
LNAPRRSTTSRARPRWQIFGSPDGVQFRSCATLFATLQPDPFTAALRKYFGGQPHPRTVEMLDAA